VKKALIVLLILAAAGAAAWWTWGRQNDTATSYRTVPVERGDLEAVVSATGTLEPVTTVSVGTQVSGMIDHLYADFNDHVKAGQVVARLDTTLLDSARRDAAAAVERNRAEMALAEQELARTSALYDAGIVSLTDLDVARRTQEVARANATSAQASLERAEQNLAYATIYSPIDGTVVERSVDVGQTVAASLSAPQLFQIAADLSHMQILAAVDESDIGQVHEGQAVHFTVQAYPDDTFTGSVRQVRLQPSTADNVVSYTAVVDVANPDGRLLPGMTATVDFQVAHAEDTLLVANAALRFRPTEAMTARLQELRQQRQQQGGEAGGGGEAPRGGFGSANGSRPGGAAGMTLLWYLDETGQPAATPVRTGITDGQRTAVTGRNVEEGMQAIVGVTSGAAAAVTNPFQGTSTQSRRRGPPGVPGM
jgi:HlyD family secretion protein